MSMLYQRLKTYFPFVGERQVTEADLAGVCADQRISVVFTPELRQGVYVRFMGRDHIFLNSSMFGISLLYVWSHEVGHALFHSPSRTRRPMDKSFVASFECKRNHREAELVAALLLLPPREITNALEDMKYADCPNLTGLLSLRLEHWNYYGN